MERGIAQPAPSTAEAPAARNDPACVIARERSDRGNLIGWRAKGWDCFATLAMTGDVAHGSQRPTPRTSLRGSEATVAISSFVAVRKGGDCFAEFTLSEVNVLAMTA